MWDDFKSVRKNAYGFYQLDPLPKAEELEEHYREKYYQEVQSATYALEYDPEELEFIRGNLEEKEHLLKMFVCGGDKPIRL